ncbi:hypothetical protein JXH92_003659 [Salmonella enterica subsp. enterica serovar 4,[5],12:b:-]|nr:hypothetical protein [Salmonella enterica subsp. enterica serovar 4,[5],12:b:-]
MNITERKQYWKEQVEKFKKKEETDLTRFQVMLSKPVHLQLKLMATQEGRDMGELLDTVLTEWLNSKK